MADYMERETAIKAIEKADCAVIADDAESCKTDYLREIIKSVPAADVAPVVHGRWEMRPTGMATDTGPEYKAYCTVCNEPNKQYQPPFCPHCGAMMDGGNGDG